MQATSSSVNEPNHPATAEVRRVFTPEERKAILDRYRASGLKQEDFVAHEGISKASLGKWLQRERRQSKANLPQPRFQEVLVPPPRAAWQLEVVSPRNWTLRFSAAPSGPALESLLRALPC